MSRVPLPRCLLAAALCGRTGLKDAVIGSQHDLTVAGSGPVKSAETSACIFCHAPHNIDPECHASLGSLAVLSHVHHLHQQHLRLRLQTPGSGSSRLCLSCHDGTVAVGLTVVQGQIATSGAMSSGDVFGSNLSSGHPVSMAPVDDGRLVTSLFASQPPQRIRP